MSSKKNSSLIGGNSHSGGGKRNLQTITAMTTVGPQLKSFEPSPLLNPSSQKKPAATRNNK